MREELIITSALIALGGFVAIELGIATSIVELIAGLVAGQLVQGVDFEVIELLADIGILSLMYVAGLEIDLDQLHKRFRPSFLLGFSSFIVPFFFVFIFCYYALGIPHDASFLVGIALSSTSIAIVYPVLRQLGGFDSDLRLILSSGMITELICIALLGFFTPNPWLSVVLILGLFVFAKLFPLLGGRIFGRVKGNVEEFEFKMILLLLLAVALISETLDFESAIVAFFMGMLTSEVVVGHEDLFVKLQGIVFGFFAPIFFFSVGLNLDAAALLENAPSLLLLFAVSFTATYAGAFLMARLLLPDYRRYVSALYNSNLTIGIIIALFGMEMGILEEGVYYSVIGAVVLSTASSLFLCRVKRSPY